MEQILADFTERMKKIFGHRLVSVVLYGSAADPGESHPKDLNLMVVAEEVTAEHLREYRNIAPKYLRKGVKNPLIVDLDFLMRSADVFPLEYMDILKRRKTLFGKDPFEEIEVDPRNLRHQIEFELKGKALLLKKVYLSTFTGKNLTIAVNESISSIFALVRGLLFLMGEEVTGTPLRDLETLEDKTGQQFPALREAKELRKANLKAKNPEDLFLRYAGEVESLYRIADTLEGDG